MSEEKIFMRVDEVAETLGISKSHAYKIVTTVTDCRMSTPWGGESA